MNFAVVGGDMRFKMLAETLARDGHTVSLCCLEKAAPCADLTEAVSGADCVILPLPALGGDGIINTPLSGVTLSARQLFGLLKPGQLVCAGKAEELQGLAEKSGVKLIDYFRREELTVSNAALTAEGAIQILLEETSSTLLGAKCLVIGFGRIGRLLALRLRAMGAIVTASARKPGDMAWIRAFGCAAEDTAALGRRLGGYDIVVNTVPALVLDANLLSQLDSDCLCLDLASRPGGIDYDAAQKLGIRAIHALGLPGKTSPLTAGRSIADTILNILSEQGVSITKCG